MSIRYKFKSENAFSQILFDGIYISVADIKKEIYKQRKLGRSENVDLMISNSSNNEKYTEDDCLVPKNTSVIVMRVPASNPSGKTKKFIKNYSQEVPQAAISTAKNFAPVSTNLLSMKGTEEDKIFAMMMQSTLDYQGYQIQPQNQFSVPPSTYVCRKCHIPGHFIRNCTFVTKQTSRYDPKGPRRENKKMTGIPMSMRNKTESESQPIYSNKVESFQVPKNLFCSICKDIFRNPVTMPCCKTIYCSECAVIKLLESDDSNCPKCDEKFIFPGMLEEDKEMRINVEKSQKVNGSSFVKYGGYINVSSRCLA